MPASSGQLDAIHYTRPPQARQDAPLPDYTPAHPGRAISPAHPTPAETGSLPVGRALPDAHPMPWHPFTHPPRTGSKNQLLAVCTRPPPARQDRPFPITSAHPRRAKTRPFPKDASLPEEDLHKIPNHPRIPARYTMTNLLLRHYPRGGSAIVLILSLFFPIGCQPDESPLKNQNEALRKQLATQESVVISLQEGNKVMQQQIDLLNRELREAKEQVERVLTERTALTKQLDAQEGKNRKLAADAQRVAEKVTQLGQALRVNDKDGAADQLPHPLPAVMKAAEDALARNGYAIRLSVKTDQKVVYITDRKVSAPASIEVAGFRNQYLVSIQPLSATSTRLIVKAEFERMTQGNRVLPSGPDETAEIEMRFIAEIRKALTSGKT